MKLALGLLAVVTAALALATVASAADCRATLASLENQIMCPVCPGETLAQTDAPIARRMKTYISQRCAAGASPSTIKDELVRDFGPRVLAAPPKHGFGLLAWLLPIGGGLAAAAILVVLSIRWTRSRGGPEPPVAAPAGVALGPELDRRVDEELARFDA